MNVLKHKTVVCFSAIFLVLDIFAQKQLALTIDDPNTYETPLMTWQERNDAMLNTLEKHSHQAALFVCGSRVSDSIGQILLKRWDEAAHMICNHSFSHFYYHSSKISSAAFGSDFQKGDSLIRSFAHYTKLFRFPYLKEGNSVQKRDSMRQVLASEGYRNGAVTIDASDWYIDAELIKALKKNPKTDLKPYRDYYIQHLMNRANYYDSLAQILFKRDVKHTLLIHHSLLNALFLDELMTAFEQKGWRFVAAEQAYQDEIFALKPELEPCGESLIWQLAKLRPDLADQLRYPGEDEAYEKVPLANFLSEYTQKKKKRKK